MNRAQRRLREREDRRKNKEIIDMETNSIDRTQPGYWCGNITYRAHDKKKEEQKVPGINCKPIDPVFVEKVNQNMWHDRSELDQFIDTIKAQSKENDYEWCWAYNHSCKYVDIRVDMRDGGFIVMDREGRRIDLATLKWQYKSLDEK